MTFSGALACIIPVRSSKPAAPAGSNNVSYFCYVQADAQTEIQIGDDNTYYEVSTDVAASRQQLAKAEINLNDSTPRSLAFIKDKDPRRPVLSIAPQTLASLSAAYGGSIPLLTLLRRIRSFLSSEERGGWTVLDTTFARHLALRQSVSEFRSRQQSSQNLPMLASACPGWVCYAEKAQGDLLPLLSSTRSPQAMQGAIVKRHLAEKWGKKANEVYHVTAMPCYDKKLEASRSDFYDDVAKTKETDCVLTTGELDLLLSELGFDPSAPVPGEDDPVPPASGDYSRPDAGFPELLTHPGSSSGSYLMALLVSLAQEHPDAALHVRRLRNSPDNEEYFLESGGQVLFKGARCYGFRNLQNLVRKVGKESGLTKTRAGGKLAAAVARRRKARTGAGEINTPATPAPGTPEPHDVGDLAAAALIAARDEKKLDFVEVMACPGGCVNGGGQMKPTTGKAERDAEGYERPLPDDGVATQQASGLVSSGLASEDGMRWSTKEWVAVVESRYWAGLPTPPSSPTISPSNPSTTEGAPKGNAKATVSFDESLPTIPSRTKAADQLADEVTESLRRRDGKATTASYKKVEGDVLSQGGLTHEQAQW
ncbi:hypothetical protein A1Q2_03739 [Trichosporon asahii var. asahii CBS 8904]|uniref:Iron hydrogenase large subunit C-terminal domain-containing protein n=1 Tax=Trichosporon asahii var. asahii (strain CBS 8904) TaxID=1220162 RepID=K1WLC8_TRIAC|nr:hypothetical protein A1Q2_03739 [Trichosporon asahii var. asahii CBS 8904]